MANVYLDQTDVLLDAATQSVRQHGASNLDEQEVELERQEV